MNTHSERVVAQAAQPNLLEHKLRGILRDEVTTLGDKIRDCPTGERRIYRGS